jgi:putative transcriptional regulator
MTVNAEAERLTTALVETAEDMRRAGVLDAAAKDKITMRHLGDRTAALVEPISAAEIRALRDAANLSQGVMGRYLGVTAGYISQLENGTRQPIGPALVLLNIIRRKGLDALL